MVGEVGLLQFWTEGTDILLESPRGAEVLTVRIVISLQYGQRFMPES